MFPLSSLTEFDDVSAAAIGYELVPSSVSSTIISPIGGINDLTSTSVSYSPSARQTAENENANIVTARSAHRNLLYFFIILPSYRKIITAEYSDGQLSTRTVSAPAPVFI